MDVDENGSNELPVEERTSSRSEDVFDLKTLQECLPPVQHQPRKYSFTSKIDEWRMLKIKKLVQLRKMMEFQRSQVYATSGEYARGSLSRQSGSSTTDPLTHKTEANLASPPADYDPTEIKMCQVPPVPEVRHLKDISHKLLLLRELNKERRAFAMRGLTPENPDEQETNPDDQATNSTEQRGKQLLSMLDKIVEKRRKTLGENIIETVIRIRTAKSLGYQNGASNCRVASSSQSVPSRSHSVASSSQSVASSSQSVASRSHSVAYSSQSVASSSHSVASSSHSGASSSHSGASSSHSGASSSHSVGSSTGCRTKDFEMQTFQIAPSGAACSDQKSGKESAAQTLSFSYMNH